MCWSHCSSDCPCCARNLLVKYYRKIQVTLVIRIARESTYDRSHGEGEYLSQFECIDECCHRGRLVRWLLEGRLPFWSKPILVVALRGKCKVETINHCHLFWCDT